MKRICLLVITIVLLSIAGVSVYFFMADYDVFIESIVSSFGKNGLKDKIRNQVLPRQRFVLLQRVAYIIPVVALLVFAMALRHIAVITGWCRFIIVSLGKSISAFRNVFNRNLPWQNGQVFALMGIIMCFFTYLMVNTYINYDEAWSYNYYTANPFYYTFFTYSGYPLYEMTTHVFKWLPFPMKINLRLSSFLFGMSSCILMYACIRKYLQDHYAAMMALIFFAFMPVATGYMTAGRGIVHELFFAIAAIFSFLFWLHQPGKKWLMVIYCIAGVLGVWSIPTHIILLLFLLVSGLLLLFKNHKPGFFFFVKMNVFILIATIIVYTPVIVATGITVVIGVISNQRSYGDAVLLFPRFVRSLLLYYTGYSYIGCFLFIAVCTGLVAVKKMMTPKFQFLLLIAIGLPVSGMVFYLLTGIRYPDRSLSFGALFIPIAASMLWYMITEHFSIINKWKDGAVISFIVLLLVLIGRLYLPVITADKKVYDLSMLFMEKNIGSCYDNSSTKTKFFYYYPGVEYYYRTRNKKIEFTLAAKKSMRYKPLLPVDRYDCIVYDLHSADSGRGTNYYEAYRDTTGKFTIWMRNDLK